MHVALLQIDLVWMNAASNRVVIEQAIADARLPRGTFVVAPEMADTGFVPRITEQTATDGIAFATAIAKRFGIWYQHGCIVLGPDGFGRNLAVVASPQGRMVARYEKIHPFGFGAETEGFRGGDAISIVAIDEDATDSGISATAAKSFDRDQDESRLLPRVDRAIVSPFICYDLRFPEVWRLAALAGAEVFAIGANWPAARMAHWRALCISRAIENQAFVIACNRVGKDPSVAYAGGSLIVSPQGEIIAEASADAATICAELDLDALRAWRERFPALRDMRRRFLGRAPCVTRDSHEVVERSH